MSDRERWIVYPLLFLAVMLGWKNNVIQTGHATFASIDCSSVTIRNDAGQPQVKIAASSSSGEITVFSKTNTRLLTIRGIESGQAGELVLHGSKGSRATIAASENGSQVRLLSTNLEPEVIVGRSAKSESIGLSAIQHNKPCILNANANELVFAMPQEIEEPSLEATPANTGDAEVTSDDETTAENLE